MREEVDRRALEIETDVAVGGRGDGRPGDVGVVNGRAGRVNGSFVCNTVKDHHDRVRGYRRPQHDRKIRQAERDLRIYVIAEDRDVAVGVASQHVQICDGAFLLVGLGFAGSQLWKADVIEGVAVG
jgi:hypothetical protein